MSQKVRRWFGGWRGLGLFATSLAIGSATNVASTIDATLLSRFPNDVRSSVVVLRTQMPFVTGSLFMRYSDYMEYAQRLTGLEGLICIVRSTGEIDAGRGVAQADVEDVSPGLWGMLRLAIPSARAAGDVETAAGIYVGEAYWRGLARDVPPAGKIVRINASPFVLRGSLPPWFERWRAPARFWRPMSPEVERRLLQSDVLSVTAIGRLRPGISAEALQAEVDVVSQAINRKRGERLNVVVVPILSDAVSGPVTIALFSAAVFVGVLLVACAIALLDLFVADLATRPSEVWIRHALGASPARIVKRQIVEVLVPVLLSGLLGIALMQLSKPILARLHPGSWQFEATSNSWRIAVFAFTLLLLIIAFVGTARIAAALRILRLARVEGGPFAQVSGAWGSALLRRFMVACHVAAATIVLAAAVLLARSFWLLQQVELGYDAKHILVVQLRLPPRMIERSAAKPQASSAFLSHLLESIRVLPGVDSAALSSQVPIPNVGQAVSLRMESGQVYLNAGPKQALAPGLNYVSAEYFRVFGIRVVRGRIFGDNEASDNVRPVLIDETMSRLHWPDQSPEGRRIRFDRNERWREVMGVVGRVRLGSVWSDFKPQAYVPLFEQPRSRIFLSVRAHDPAAVRIAVERQIVSNGSDISIMDSRPLAEHVSGSFAETSYLTAVLGLLAVVAAIVTTGSVFSTVVRSVSSRYRELQIRMALGISVWRLAGTLYKDLVLSTVAGLACGTFVMWSTRALLSPFLFRQTDIVTLSVLSLVEIALALLCLGIAAIPLRKLVQSAPARLLQNE